jgi:hypothetical protein
MAKKKRVSLPKPASAHQGEPVYWSAHDQGEPYFSGQNNASANSYGSANTSPTGKSQLLAMPAELGAGDWTAIILALMLFIAPALGVPNELMLQDTLKSIIVAFMSLGAMLLMFYGQRNRREALRWHFAMWLPLLLCAYALGSMVWSHSYLAGVEAIRWFLFAVILWLVLNCASRERFPMLAWGVHLGAVAVALLGASQFGLTYALFPRGLTLRPLLSTVTLPPSSCRAPTCFLHF